MRLIRAVLAALVAFTPCPAPAQDWPVTRVYDGDTFFVELPDLPPELRSIGVRIRGIDAPEAGSRAKCDSERRLAVRAKARLTDLLRGDVAYRDLGWDKYGGRILATVLVDGRDIAAILIGEGLARPYDGGRRAGWC